MKWVRRRVHVCTCMYMHATPRNRIGGGGGGGGGVVHVQEVYFWYMVKIVN